MKLAQEEVRSLTLAKLGNKLWKTVGPFRDARGLYWKAAHCRLSSFELAERVAREHNRRLLAWAEREIRESLQIA